MRSWPGSEFPTAPPVLPSPPGPLLTGFLTITKNPRQATQIGIHGEWAFIFDVAAHGRTSAPDVLRSLSRDAEVLSVRKILMSTTLITHARNGKILSSFNSWTFQPPEGEDPAPLTEALHSVGFFTEVQEEAMEEAEWSDSTMVLLALERGFGVDLPPDLRSRPLITVPLLAQDS